MSRLESLDHIRKVCEQDSTRVNILGDFINIIEKNSCCIDAKNTVKILRRESDGIRDNLKSQEENIKVLEFKRKETYGYSDISPLIMAEDKFKGISRMSNLVYYHTILGKDKKFSKGIHALQALVHECCITLNNIRPLYRPIAPICLLLGGTLMQIPSYTEIVPIGVPYVDLKSVSVWSNISHEVSHGFFKHRRHALGKDNYEDEFKADFYATVILGPAYFLSFSRVYGGIPGQAMYAYYGQNDIAYSHPFVENRLTFCIDVLEKFLHYDKDFIEELRDGVKPLFYYESDPMGAKEKDEKDEKQKDVAKSILSGYSSDEKLKKSILLHGLTYSELSDIKALQDSDIESIPSTMDPRKILNRIAIDIFLNKTIESSSEKISEIIIDHLYDCAKRKLSVEAP